jgi:aspartyl-tRNA(Asn)/glutamyl-tRNA(Gln) amidotransferase subunit C
MKISTEEVQETALLARIDLTAEEVERLRAELDTILGYMEKLNALDVSNVEPTTHAVPLDCPLRTDELDVHLPIEATLGGAPRSEGSFFEVPKIIEVSE